MKLTIIIVNYNVEYFLEQCLHSVYKAIHRVSSEVFVVDNNSVDGSVEMVKTKFPEVKLIENKKNTGFSFANNQAIKLACGEYVLLLNPDTVVEEDTFEKVVSFMDDNSIAGGLGVYMIDGKGKFLPESKRGLPTPEVAFYKVFGLSRLFPKSRRFGRYHLGFLDKNKVHEVEILSGAFMLLRKETLDKTGLLDETFFMYGEDIDLSYRIIKAGYKNYYFPKTRIIHYKGESTKKSSVNYVFVFYNAMIIFAQKHFSQQHAKTFSFLINFAVYLRASAAIISRFLKKTALPLFDASIILIGLFLLKNYWEKVVKVEQALHFETELLTVAFPFYTFIWLLSVLYSGGYDKPVKPLKIIKGIGIGTGVILIVYSLLSEQYRFSRALIVFGAMWAVFSLVFFRYILHLIKIKGFDLNSEKKKRILIVGHFDEFSRVSSLLKLTDANPSFIGNVVPDEQQNEIKKHPEFLGTFDKLEDILEIYKIDEVIFCARDISSHIIINQMAQLRNIDYKIAPPESLYIIGSNSVDTSGDLYSININSISRSANKRNKRLFDIATSLSLLTFLPINIFLVDKPYNFFKNIFIVLSGNKSWVSYAQTNNAENFKLPKIKSGILHTADPLRHKKLDEGSINKMNLLYAKDYRISNDLSIILKCFKELGRK
ncbi:MAG: glycosyltransferase [Bacteroidetes bacterium]|nr:glycosyltransferase [Bacteroidota bacterium]HET6243397.1 glycosyltransferase [Bacteroidia bacterium]